MSDETTGPTRPEAEGDYLSAAANWLALAEENTQAWQDFRLPMQDRVDSRATVTVFGRLAELNIAMATACGAYQDRRPTLSTVSMDEAMAGIRERLAADIEREQSVRLTGTDPEPESSDGDLWIDVEPPGPDRNPYLYKLGPDRWTWANDYAEVLRSPGMGASWATCTDGGYVVRRPSQEERERFYAPPEEPATEPPCSCCASGLLNAGADGDPCRDCGHAGPAHYVPEQDYAPTPPEAACGQFDSGDNGSNPITRSSICERCGASAQAHIQRGLQHLADVGVDAPPPIPVRHVQATSASLLDAFTDSSGTTLAELTNEELAAFVHVVRRLLFDRGYVLQQDKPRGGHEEWRG